MGAGKNNSRALPNKQKSGGTRTLYTGANSRNLSKNELGGVIFGCKNYTYDECVENKIFGLPAPHISYVRNVTPGLALFLFNYSSRKLHGIFEAASHGQLNINPFAWITNEGTETTPFPAQVRISFQRQCRPLYEEEFKPIIARNYYTDRLFCFELDKTQTTKLIQLFISSSVPEPKPQQPKTVKMTNVAAAKKNNKFGILSSHETEDDTEELDPPESSGWPDLKQTAYSSASGNIDVKWEYPSSGHDTNWYLPEPLGLVIAKTDSSLQESWDELGKHERKDSLVAAHSSASGNIDVEWQYPSSGQDTNWLLPEPSGVVIGKADSSLQESWQDLEKHESKDPCVEVHTQDSWSDYTNMPQSESLPYLGVEAGVSIDTESELVKVDTDALNCNKEDVISDNTSEPMEKNEDLPKIDTIATSSEVEADLKSSTHESIIIKLMHEVEELKVTQLQQKQKIEFLEQAYKGLCTGTIPTHASDHMDIKNSKSASLPSDDNVFIVGGYDGCSWLPELSSYSPSLDHIIQLCPMTFTRTYNGIAQLNGELYVFGGTGTGTHNKEWFDTVELYKPTYNQWFQRPSLNKPKGSLAGASLGEKIYAIGGGSGSECYSEVEVFDINNDRWIFTEPMLEKRFAPAATTINGAIYVAGGYDGRVYLRSVERFDPREKAWTAVASMNSKRGCHSLVTFNEKIYAMGGHNGTEMVSTTEVFDPRTGSWAMDEPMHFARGYFGSFVHGGKIYVLGGVMDKVILNRVECYEEGLGWRNAGLAGAGRRCFFSAIVMK
ncbi:uncharacterized protein LOC127259897 [Andrographis paniculata]|uniref:uncharacterized protein LOC127259897 n=1 Tax=Andrographis paniculata TaxID=175694 RepID=UPI0021E979CA|nr:uncharacterized protein LOC127259897 [Andrographis paniculata]XP_051143473.1 uncharacterized protein LOC127259897 [Andrographis paniculata]